MKTMVKRSTDQELRLQNFDARSERIETGAVVKSHRGSNGVARGQGEAINGKERTVFERDKCSFPRDGDEREKNKNN